MEQLADLGEFLSGVGFLLVGVAVIWGVSVYSGRKTGS
jgi:hypothetical protein